MMDAKRSKLQGVHVCYRQTSVCYVPVLCQNG